MALKTRTKLTLGSLGAVAGGLILNSGTILFIGVIALVALLGSAYIQNQPKQPSSRERKRERRNAYKDEYERERARIDAQEDSKPPKGIHF